MVYKFCLFENIANAARRSGFCWTRTISPIEAALLKFYLAVHLTLIFAAYLNKIFTALPIKAPITFHNAKLNLHIRTTDSMIKKRACTLVFDSLQSKVCDVVKGYLLRL